MDTPTNDSRWRAVLARDSDADGRFVFAVKTTGIYCRPSCPARHAKRENVLFFASPDAARGAGFRPCRRCRPNAADNGIGAAVREACALIEREGDVSLSALAARIGYSASHFQRAFKRAVGVSPKQYALERKVAHAERALAAGARVTDAMLDAGFGSASRFYAARRGRDAVPPSAARHRAKGHAIRYSIAPTSLGFVLLAATERGVCAIEFGETREALERLARERYVSAEPAAPASRLARWAARITTFVERPRGALDLPLDVRGTSFQRRVWQALQAMRAGERTTYTELAATIGRPAAVRAVARACATNPVALAIPCHRVVAKDGRLAGYRWGIERKRALLERESVAAIRKRRRTDA